ncbi:MAG: hypothetical protein ACRDRO_04680 [Pseudonocardiaceae bacterium]
MAQEQQGVTPFGTVTPDLLIYNVQQGWFTGRSLKEIPLHHVTSVKLEIKRHRFFGVLSLLIALACGALDSIGTLIAIVPLSLAVLLLWGLPLVRVNTTDEGDLPPATGPPWTRPEAEWFVATVDQRRR